MKNKELIDYCNSCEDCYFCPYDRKECDLFIEETGCAPWTYRKNDEEFLNRDVETIKGEMSAGTLDTVDKIAHAHMICDDCFHNTVCRLDGNEMLEWCSARVPSANVVEVARCKDCKKYKPYENDNFPCGECGNCSYDVRPRVVGDNDYCSDAERKEEENGCS